MDITTYALCKKLVSGGGTGDVFASEVSFTDGEDLQSKYDKGEFTGGGTSGYSKQEIDTMLAKKPDRVLESDKGRTEFQNLEDGNQLLFLTKDGKRANISVNDGSNGIYVQLGAMDAKTNTGARLQLGLDKAYYTVGDTYQFTNDDEIITKAVMKHETQDLLQGLSRELLPDEEENNSGFSSQTVVKVRTRNNATETIMEIDNLDVKTDIPVNAVLGAAKGQDLDERVSALESRALITISTSMTKEDRTNHNYPEFALTEEQINTIVNNDSTLLKIKFTISDSDKDSEIDTLVFYTTIDDNLVIDGGNTVRKVNINAVRTNYEGTIIYHGELLGNGEVFRQSVNLEATYIPFVKA